MQEVRTGPDGKRTIHEAFNIHTRDSVGRLRDEQLATTPDQRPKRPYSLGKSREKQGRRK
jgi:hypothetical protein